MLLVREIMHCKPGKVRPMVIEDGRREIVTVEGR